MKSTKPPGKGSSLKGGGGSSSGTPATPATPTTDRKSRWESADNPASGHNTTAGDLKPSYKLPNPKDIPAGPSAARPPTLSPHDRPIHPSSVPPPLHPLANSPFPQPDSAAAPPTPPSYGFHNLDRRTIVLADGSVRSYFALPPDYPMDPPAPERFFPYGPGGRPGLGPGPELGLDRHFPPPGPRFSPESFRDRDREREPPPFGRGPGAPQHDYWSSLGLDGPRAPPEGGQSSLKRKYGEDDEFAWHRQHVLQYGNPNGIPSGSGGDRSDYLGRAGSPLRREHPDDLRLSKQAKFGGEGLDALPPQRSRPDNDVTPVVVDVDQQALKRAFLKFAKLINENLSQKKNYLEDGKNGPLKCIVCDRASSKEFADVHGLIMHAYNSQNADLHADHLGLHKALCVLMGWNFAKAPENSKAYQSLSDDVVTANREDLIIWPPTVIIHNTNSGRRKDGRMEGLGNKDMDTKLKELGFGGGKSKSMYGKEGHTGITLVKFANTHAGLKEAERLADFFVKDHHGRKGWARAQASQSGDDDEKNPALVKADEKSGEKKRIFYGYLATVSDLERVDHEMRKKAVIKSRREFDLSD